MPLFSSQRILDSFQAFCQMNLLLRWGKVEDRTKFWGT
ncbi:hypothetical protein SCG7109_AK_00180 [Chlamydiales bacterium SCGC AG-110-M15]|nr:hypothetical protein SCG7109_AK_00180 [Chlamydiales bacterium SCGC AG-110-M15]